MSYDVTVIGGGPAGLAAAVEAEKQGASVLLLEREAAPGGMLKQCVHDGFGLARFGERLTGPEYAARYIEQLERSGCELWREAFVTSVERTENGFRLAVITARGVRRVETGAIVLATGCRERTGPQVAIHGTRPAGVITAGAAQHYVNRLGLMPAGKTVILGSGDIGLIMARRLALEGAEVLGVYEILPHPSGLARNISQCLNDFNIPLHLSRTVTRVFGEERLCAVETMAVDDTLTPIPGTEERIACDTLLLSVGLIPENELARKIGCGINEKDTAPLCDEYLQTDVRGVFVCGSAQRDFDVVDWVSASGETAGRNAALQVLGREEEKTPFKQPQNAAAVKTPIGKNDVVCIVCPNGCVLRQNPGTGAWEGNRCPRGAVFAAAERERPMRTVTGTVRTAFKSRPVLPVRTDGELPRERLADVMARINGLRVNRPVTLGEVLIENVCGLGVNVIATADLKEEAL